MEYSRIKSVSILGCGWLGERIAKHLLKKDYTVFGSSRSQKRLDEIEGLGVNPYIVDLTNISKANSEFFSTETLIISTNNKDILAHKKLIDLVEKSSINKVFFISSTSVYEGSDSVIDESSQLTNSVLVDIEKLYFSSNKTCILRCGGLVGDNRHPGRFFKQKSVIKNPDGVINLIHFEDINSCIAHLIIENQHKVYNLVSAEHPNRFLFYSGLHKEINNEKGNFLRGENNLYKEVSSNRISEELGIKLELKRHYQY